MSDSIKTAKLAYFQMVQKTSLVFIRAVLPSNETKMSHAAEGALGDRMRVELQTSS